ncbi:hypothetical protein BHM03_00038492 [Ensete ventricosum]|nr:hypothetical protein BHM03_00038492 [Ensete ventricosum]
MIPVRGLSVTGWYHRNRLSAVDFDRRWSIDGERRRGRRREKRGRCLLFIGSPHNPLPAGDSSPMGFLLLARGDEARKEKGTRRRENEATPRLPARVEGDASFHHAEMRRCVISLCGENGE